MEMFKEKYKGLLQEKRRYYTANVVFFVSYMGGFILFVASTIKFFSVFPIYISENQSVDITQLILLVVSLASFFISAFIGRKSRSTEWLTPEEWFFLDIYEVSKLLGQYPNDTKRGRYYRKNAAKKLKKAINILYHKKWTLGYTQLVKKSVGDKFDTFRKNLTKRLLPAIEEGEEHDFTHSQSVLGSLMEYLIYPTLEGLDNLNERMSHFKIDRAEEPMITEKISSLPRKMLEVRNALVLSAPIGGGVAWFIGSLAGIPIEYIYVVSFATFCSILGVYVTYLKSEK